MKRVQKADERWRTLEVGGGAPDELGRWLVFVGGRRYGERKGFSNVLGQTPDERSMSVLDVGRSLEVGGGSRDKNVDGRMMDGGNPAMQRPPNAPKASSYSPCTILAALCPRSLALTQRYPNSQGSFSRFLTCKGIFENNLACSCFFTIWER